MTLRALVAAQSELEVRQAQGKLGLLETLAVGLKDNYEAAVNSEWLRFTYNPLRKLAKRRAGIRILK